MCINVGNLNTYWIFFSLFIFVVAFFLFYSFFRLFKLLFTLTNNTDVFWKNNYIYIYIEVISPMESFATVVEAVLFPLLFFFKLFFVFIRAFFTGILTCCPFTTITKRQKKSVSTVNV